MNSELLAILEYIEQERGISREMLLDALEQALVSAARKSVEQPATELKVDFMSKSGEFKVIASLEVVEDSPTLDQIILEKARERFPEAKPGDTIEWEVTPRNFGRIAAQTAKQAMMQQIRRAEKHIVEDEFKTQLNQIVNGTVRRYDSGNIVVDLQKAEGVLTYKERIPGENYMPGDRINALLVDIDSGGSGPSLILSRSRLEFVTKLFEREVAEIHDGIVEIKAIAREPGSRTKIAVDSKDSHVDPIGACVGMRGMRVKNITGELGGEKIDIIRYETDLKTYVANALQPASLRTIVIDEENDTVNVTVDEDQLSLAIGRRGQNVRLTSKLIGWKVNIHPSEESHRESFEEQLEKAVSSLAGHLKIELPLAEKLIRGGFVSIDGVREAERSDLETIEDMSAEEVDTVLAALAKE